MKKLVLQLLITLPFIGITNIQAVAPKVAESPFLNGGPSPLYFTKNSTNNMFIVAAYTPGIFKETFPQLTFNVVTPPTHGTVTMGPTTQQSIGAQASTNLYYTPTANTNYAGPDSFTFNVTNTTPGETSGNQTVNIIIPDSVPTIQIIDLPTSLLIEGICTAGSAPTFEVTAAPTNGKLSLQPKSKITSNGPTTYIPYQYTSNGKFNGIDSFTFTMTNPVTKEIATQTVTITVGTPAPIVTNGKISLVLNNLTGKSFTLHQHSYATGSLNTDVLPVKDSTLDLTIGEQYFLLLSDGSKIFIKPTASNSIDSYVLSSAVFNSGTMTQLYNYSNLTIVLDSTSTYALQAK